MIKIIAITNPIIPEIKTPNDFIAYVARVSNPLNQLNSETSEKLIAYCAKHKHWSVFETVNVVIEVETTRDIGRQILRHRSFSFQEFSQRYADPTKSFEFVFREARLQDKKNRQNSIEVNDKTLQKEWELVQENQLNHSIYAYNWAIENGIAKEQARAVLPEGMTKTRMYINGTLRSWIHYCNLRMSPETQKEHREVAAKIWDLILEHFPVLSLINKES
jgi:thymidylate synthase (FAD)